MESCRSRSCWAQPTPPRPERCWARSEPPAAGERERRGRVVAEVVARRARAELRSSAGRWGATPLFFYGFDDLAPLERDAIEALSRISGSAVTVSLTYEPGRTALAARAEVVEELRALAERVVELPALDRHYESPALHMLERRLFEPAGDRPDPGSAV